MKSNEYQASIALANLRESYENLTKENQILEESTIKLKSKISTLENSNNQLEKQLKNASRKPKGQLLAILVILFLLAITSLVLVKSIPSLWDSLSLSSEEETKSGNTNNMVYDDSGTMASEEIKILDIKIVERDGFKASYSDIKIDGQKLLSGNVFKGSIFSLYSNKDGVYLSYDVEYKGSSGRVEKVNNQIKIEDEIQLNFSNYCVSFEDHLNGIGGYIDEELKKLDSPYTFIYNIKDGNIKANYKME